ncbi:hypothetical protein GCM10023170_054940 [Phytohabitans houttuyneae]|uniref:Peptidase S8/S53 domain-containing protein n=1 Tax=Phytohabitans houttuyneae TaxID=1076126 RepID=A0A6V8KIH7_9ACTN|nr:hypothetical protein Phou_063880 [Phytohabitans houttuyneae]
MPGVPSRWLALFVIAALAAGLAPATASAAPPPAAAAGESVRVIVGLRADFDPSSLRQQATRASAQERIATAAAAVETELRGVPHTIHHRYDSLPYLALTAPSGAIDALRKAGRITSVQRDEAERVALSDSTRIIGAQEATAHGFDGTGRVIAVLDTGVERTHPFLSGRVVEEACFSGNSNCPNGSTSQTGVGAAAPCTYSPSECPHGTHVAGIAAGRRSGSITFDGVAPGASVMPIQVFSRFTGTFDCGPLLAVCAKSFQSDQVAGLNQVINRLLGGVRIAAVNISIGSAATQSTACDSDVRKTAIDSLRAQGVPTVIASGNSGSNTGVSTPACISTAVTVGNTTKADAVASDSNSSQQVDLLAPGSSIVSSVPGGGTATMSGTSMAAPHVAGAMAVYRERFPGTDLSTVLATLHNTGVVITDPDNLVVKRRINISTAMAGYAFVWANQPSSASYTPDTFYQWNSTAATVQIIRQGTGDYMVQLFGLAGTEQAAGLVAGGHVQVTMHGQTTNRCKVGDWFMFSTSELRVRVLCHTTAGAAVDNRFSMLYYNYETVRAVDMGYAWVSASGSAPTLWQANSSAATAVNTVTHTAGSGIYTVLFPGLTDGNGNAQVTAVGGGSEYCKIRSSSVVAAGAQVVVGCHNAAGTLVDAAFDVAYTAGAVPSDGHGAYGTAHLSSSTAWYNLNNRFNTSGGVVQARRTPGTSAGTYEVRLGNQVDFDDTNTIVTAIGTSGTTCGIEFWVASGSDTLVQVSCRSPAGTPINSQFSLLFTTNR